MDKTVYKIRSLPLNGGGGSICANPCNTVTYEQSSVSPLAIDITLITNPGSTVYHICAFYTIWQDPLTGHNGYIETAQLPRGATYIHSCVVILKQTHADPTLNTIFTVKLWPLITDIHSKRLSFSLTYHKHTTHTSDPKHWPLLLNLKFGIKFQKCHKSLQNGGE